MADLFQHSIHVILANQVPSGAYVASPNFPVYSYCWFRDGAFIAYAMDLVGEHDSAWRFHDWAAHTILRHADKAQRAIEKAQQGEPLDNDYLHTRYTLDGDEGPADWPNFQLDGLGTWLWALAEHVRRRPPALSPAEGTADRRSGLPAHWQQAVDLITRYLAALWPYPCYDLWEEYPHYLHPYTLATIYAGLNAADSMMTAVSGRPSAVVEEIRRFVLKHGAQNGHLVKHVRPEDVAAAAIGGPPSAVVDASLIGVATPYRLLAPDDPVVRATVARIETDLHCQGGGVHRYQADTYYGGGEWVLLAAWLGWYYTERGMREKAEECLAWVQTQADTEGNLPEQVPQHLLAPEHYPGWEALRGAIAKPLLWSHAMALILQQALYPA
ncbi:MAG: glycoside hydrolase family 15 protein [Chloroflexota bacterium]